MDEDKLIIFNRDGSKTTVEDPFRPMKAVYDALRKDPTAAPDLNDESKAAILAEIANGTASTAAIEADPEVERGILTLEGCLITLGAVVVVYGLIYLAYLLIWN